MTPIYRSPDRDQTQAMQSLLADHQIQTSIIESRKTSNSSDNSSVVWHELWLRNLNELTRAKTIITQHEFTTYRNSMTSYRTSVVAQKKHTSSIDQAINPDGQTGFKTKISPQNTNATAGSSKKIPSPVVSQPSISNPFLSKPASDTNAPAKPVIRGQLREDLIPINNKRVFKRLGLLLGFSEEQIQQWDNNNRLYRPWDAGELNESVKRLKQKTS